MKFVLRYVKSCHRTVKILWIAFFAQIWYHEAQVIMDIYLLDGFVGHPPEPWIRLLICKAVTRFCKSLIGVIRLSVNDIIHENHRD